MTNVLSQEKADSFGPFIGVPIPGKDLTEVPG